MLNLPFANNRKDAARMKPLYKIISVCVGTMKADIALPVVPFKDAAISGNPPRAPIAPNRVHGGIEVFERVHGRHMLRLVTVHVVTTHSIIMANVRDIRSRKYVPTTQNTSTEAVEGRTGQWTDTHLWTLGCWMSSWDTRYLVHPSKTMENVLSFHNMFKVVC